MVLRLIVALVLALLASPALALCVAEPESAGSGFVERNLQQSLCLQQELARDAARRIELMQLNTQINALELQTQLDRLRAPTFSTFR